MTGKALIYCGTPPVSAMNTLALLESPMHAIWFPPGARRIKPSPGDIIWLIWRERQGSTAVLLGAGKLRATADGEFLWTCICAVNLVPAALSHSRSRSA